MHVTGHNHVVVKHKIAVRAQVLYGKSVRPVVADCVFRRKVAETSGRPATSDLFITGADDSDRVGVVRVLMEMATDRSRPEPIIQAFRRADRTG